MSQCAPSFDPHAEKLVACLFDSVPIPASLSVAVQKLRAGALPGELCVVFDADQSELHDGVGQWDV